MTARTVIEPIGPLDAAVMLTAQNGNRPLDPTRVAHFLRVLRAGGWRQSATPITIAADGRLLNGQHRLCAILASGLTVPVPVLREGRPS